MLLDVNSYRDEFKHRGISIWFLNHMEKTQIEGVRGQGYLKRKEIKYYPYEKYYRMWIFHSLYSSLNISGLVKSRTMI